MLRMEKATGSAELSKMPQLATAFAMLLLVFSALYVALAIAPFYLHGINQRSYAEIFGSAVDVKGYTPFSWPVFGPLFQMGAMLSVFLVRVCCPLVCGALAISGWLGWRRSAPAARITWLVAATAALSLTLVSWTTQDIILTWLAN
jgi:hypothetical protein